MNAVLRYLIGISVKQRKSILGAQGSGGLIAGRGWINATIALCSWLAAWQGCSSPALSVWSVKALQAWAAAVLGVLGAQLCFPTSGLPRGPLCCSGPETMLSCVRAPIPSAHVRPASALPLGVNTLPLTHHLLQDVLGNILLKSFFFSYGNFNSTELSGQF